MLLDVLDFRLSDEFCTTSYLESIGDYCLLVFEVSTDRFYKSEITR